MDRRQKEAFINEYITLCKKHGMYLWSGEPWYGLDLIVGDIDEEEIRKEIVSYKDEKLLCKTNEEEERET